MRARPPASERTSQRIEQLMNALEQSEESATFSKLAMRKGIEEVLEAEVAERLGRGFYERATGECEGHRNGYRTGRLKTPEGAVDYSVPQSERPDWNRRPSARKDRPLRLRPAAIERARAARLPSGRHEPKASQG